MSCVLDSSALIAFLKAEPGKDFVAAGLDEAVISAVNAAEIVSYFLREGGSTQQARRALTEAAVPVLPLDEALGFRTGELVGLTRRWGLSLADCACLALAEARNDEAWTADRVWIQVNLPIKIKLIR